MPNPAHWRLRPLVFVLKILFGTILSAFGSTPLAQEFLPSAPADRHLVYTLDDQNELVPLPFEQGQTPLRADAIAKSEKVSYVELKGEHSATAMKSDMPRLFLFTSAQQGSHPPFLVWLTAHRGARRVTAIAQAGMRGFAIASEEIVKPSIRVLARDGDMVFMELRPRASLVPGE